MKKKKTQSAKKNKSTTNQPVDEKPITPVEESIDAAQDGEGTPSGEPLTAEEKEANDVSPSSEEGEEGESHANLIQVHAELARCQDQLLRLQAEFTNFRKRKEKELSENIKFANAELLRSLLPILDNFDRTLDAIEKTDNLAAIKEGISMVDQSMKRQLEKIGLQPIQEHVSFDVNLHEVISAIPVPEEEKKGKIIDVVEKGYVFKEKVIRFSKVVIGE